MLHLITTSRKPNILIVDDDATIRLLMRDTLTDELFTINEAENGTEALEQIKQQQPDLVLLDVNMPGLNGFDVCKEIRRLYGDSEISIVMVTGLEDSASIEKAFSLGATDFISKPINWDTLPYRIQYLIKARNAIIETKYKEIHLQYIENISHIVTQNKAHAEIMHETLITMLNVFSADRVFIIKPELEDNNTLVIESEVRTGSTTSIKTIPGKLVNILGNYTIHRAEHSEYPIITNFGSETPAPAYDPELKQQMIKALHLLGNQTWYLVIQQYTKPLTWSFLDKETFYKIGLRLTGILSRYLLTEELHQSEQLLKQAQKIGHLGNWNWKIKNNALTWSDEIYRIYGHEVGRCLPDCEKFYEIKFEEDKQRYNLFKNILGKSCDSYQIDHRIITVSGKTKWVREQCIGSYDHDGKLLELNGIVQDITDSQYKKEQEVHNNKMDAIGQLTSGIAHDFGNLMTVAKGNLDLLKESIQHNHKLNDDNLELIQDAQSAVDDGVELTKQLLAFSRKKSIAPVSVSIEKTIRKFQKLLKNTVGDNIELSINIQQDLPDILVDPTQFESSILNIVINSRNAMPDGGKITINAKVMETQRSQVMIRNADNDLGEQCVCIYIKDNGAGMSNDVLKHAIEPFYTTSKTTGTGLGLSMVYGFIQQSSGELLIHSKLNKGTTIYLQFPIYDGQEIKQTKADHNYRLPGDTNATVLIVEDQSSVRQFAVRCLNTPGITIFQAENAAEARKILNTNKDIDLLFTDILMPGDMDGYELASWAGKKYPKLKILLTTAMENQPFSKQPVRKYRFQILAKPYNKLELTETISKSLQ